MQIVLKPACARVHRRLCKFLPTKVSARDIALHVLALMRMRCVCVHVLEIYGKCTLRHFVCVNYTATALGTFHIKRMDGYMHVYISGLVTIDLPASIEWRLRKGCERDAKHKIDRNFSYTDKRILMYNAQRFSRTSFDSRISRSAESLYSSLLGIFLILHGPEYFAKLQPLSCRLTVHQVHLVFIACFSFFIIVSFAYFLDFSNSFSRFLSQFFLSQICF